ncbi:MAG: hypothetical protein GY811_13215 [Myxococcales bacterium]|nr:hypothetical protein [Myxococcales bacterium]
MHKPRVTYVVLFLVGFATLALVSGDRMGKQSSDPHFVLQADAWLHGNLHIEPPWKGDDPAKVETVQIKNGREVRGRYLHTRAWLVSNPWFEKGIREPSAGRRSLPMTRMFRTTSGEDIPATDIQKSLGSKNYVSFPPTPALLMLPSTLVHGRRANDVVPTLLIAALILPLCFATLRRFAAEGLSERSDSENLWLAAQLSFGTVLFFVSVSGKVWFTAHVVGVACALAYANFSIGARRPILAGLMLGLATLTRTPMAFMLPFFALEAVRSVCGQDWFAAWRGDFNGQWKAHGKGILKLWLRFAIPVVAIAIIAGVNNFLRFDSATEFGHSYLAVRQQGMIEAYGLFDYEYLRRNLSVAFTMLPGLSSTAPYVHISPHGIAIWFTTPLFISLLWPRLSKGRVVHHAMWITVACVAVPILFYQNSGWAQFGYRFSLDYTPFLILLLAVGRRPLRRVAKFLIVLSILVNLFGAITFGRHHKYYDGGSYSVVIPHHPHATP